ncbi:MAG: alpha/beta hydrolase, partial [Bacteroidota bacterium]
CLVIVDRRKRILLLARRLIIAALATILIWTVITMLFEDKFIFFPTAYPGGMYEDARFIRGLKDSMIVAEDGVRIHTWFAPADSAVATLVMSHGNAGNISHRIEIIRRLQNTGFHVLMFDYRGYGKSEGSPSEEGIYRDGRAAFDHAAMIPGVDPKKIFLWGTSLGGAVAVDVATQRPAAGLILESSFSSARDVARVAYPFLPIHLVLRTQLDSFEKIQRIRTPLLMMHGDRDSIIPIELGKKLFDVANEPKEFFVIAGADHNDTFIVGGRAYLEKPRDFVVKSTARKTN